jgi:hypothetical protein
MLRRSGSGSLSHSLDSLHTSCQPCFSVDRHPHNEMCATPDQQMVGFGSSCLASVLTLQQLEHELQPRGKRTDEAGWSPEKMSEASMAPSDPLHFSGKW